MKPYFFLCGLNIVRSANITEVYHECLFLITFYVTNIFLESPFISLLYLKKAFPGSEFVTSNSDLA